MAKKEEEHDPTLGPAVTPVHIGGESLMDRIIPHMKKIVVIAIGGTVVLTIFFGIRWWKHRKAEKATNQLAHALERGQVMVIPGYEPDPTAPKSSTLPETYGSYAKRAEDTLAGLKKSGEVRGAASLYEAQLLVQTGKLDDALAIYKRVGTGTSTDAVVAREGVGVVLETKAAASKDPAEHKRLMEEALAAYRAVQPDDKGPRRDYSLYHEGRVLESMGKTADAVTALQKALAVVPDTQLKPLIEQRLAALGAGETL
jgi:predicted negative regulator of RcsB-dependent stress response